MVKDVVWHGYSLELLPITRSKDWWEAFSIEVNNLDSITFTLSSFDSLVSYGVSE